ncbi:MAG: NFACT family protein, partial [Firmicutes bacterium]|nr:NFACT family protein [Bacillota bacterium]
MALDGLFLYKLLTETAEDLLDAKINRVHQPDRLSITLKLKSHTKGSCTLLMTAHPQNARLQLTNESYDNPRTPPLFAMVLRKHIEGGRITNISQNGLDRVADITIEARNEIGDLRERHLIIEIMGKHSNIILCDEDRTILAAIKQYGNNVSRYRQVLPHEPYILPPPSGKENPFFLTEEEFTEKLMDQNLALTIPKAILKTVEGISPQTAAEIAYRAGIENDFLLEEAGIYECQRIFEELQKLANEDIRPTLIKENGITTDFYFSPLAHYEGDAVAFDNLGELLDGYFGTKEKESAFFSRKTNLLKFISQLRDKTAKKAEKQEEELANAIDGEKYRLYGELLSANLWQVKNNIEEVTLENFYDNNAPITIPLKKELTAADNASIYFKRYNKAKASRNA